jgi:hypothetical protein
MRADKKPLPGGLTKEAALAIAKKKLLSSRYGNNPELTLSGVEERPKDWLFIFEGNRFRVENTFFILVDKRTGTATLSPPQ